MAECLEERVRNVAKDIPAMDGCLGVLVIVGTYTSNMRIR